MVQFPQTYGPFKSPLARRLARFLLRRSCVVIARDEESRRLAQELVGPEREVWLSPDVAFSLEAARPERLELDPPLPQSVVSGQWSVVSKPIGLNVSGLLYSESGPQNRFGLKLDYSAFVPSLIAALLRESGEELWLVPHTYGTLKSDPEACRQVRAALPPELQKRIRIMTGEYDCHQLKYVIGQCDFFIGSRMHACIAALSQGVPAVGVAYSKKFAGVFETVGMKEWVIDGRSASAQAAVARVMELYRKRDETRDPLKARAQAARAQLHRVFADLFAAVTRPTTCARLKHRSTDAPNHRNTADARS